MKITYKGDYALKALLQLALHYNEGDVLSINEIAKLGDMPVKFLEQILLILRKGGFVKSKRGVQGGFSLGRHPKDITVGEVISLGCWMMACVPTNPWFRVTFCFSMSFNIKKLIIFFEITFN